VSTGSELPTGTVTFLFTDIEGSTRLLKQLRDRYAEALAEHQRILRATFADHDGREIDTQGDSFFVAFRRASDAVGAAVAGQKALAEHEWPDDTELRVRMGVHTGEPAVGGERYVGLGVHRAARISAAGHGGQVLVSQTTRELLRDDPRPDVSLRDLGEHQLKDLDEPERIYQLVAPGLGADFPPLKTAARAPFEGREGEIVEAAEDAVQELARPWHRDRRLLAGAVAVGIAALGIVLGLLLTKGGGSASASGEVAANAVGVIDAKSGKIESAVPVGIAPTGVAAARDSIWVTNADGKSVSRIDPATNHVEQTITVGNGPSGLAVHGKTVWVANGLDGTVSRISTETNQVLQTIAVGNGPAGVAYGDGAVWVANSVDGTVSRIDPESGRVTRTIAVAPGASSVAVGVKRVWIASPSAGTVVALDPRSGEVDDRIGVGVDPAAVATGAGAVWVANRADGTVSRIDPRARVVTATINVGRAPNAVSVGAAGVWVANGGGTLSKIDPSSDRVIDTVALSNPPQGLDVASRRLYVAVRGTGAAHRGGTLRVSSGAGLDTVDPALAYAPDSWATLPITNDGLVAFRRTAGIQGIQLVPDLAESLPIQTSGGTVFTFRLRPNIHYSNGRLVRPEDFRRALERVFEARPQSVGAQHYATILGADRCRPGRRCDLSRGIVADNVARTVTFRLRAPDPDFLTKLALTFAVAVPADTPARGVARVPATGAYMVASFTKRMVKLVRNARFREWSADARPDGYPAAITISEQKSPDPLARAKVIEHGGADLSPGFGRPLSKQQLADLATRFPSQLHTTPFAATHYFFLNTRIPPFDDVRVRLAVNYALDRQAFRQVLGRGFAPTCQILPPNYPSYRRTCPYGRGGVAALDRARSLVRQSGRSGAPVTVWVLPAVAPAGGVVVSVLRSLGFRARLHVFPKADAAAYFNHVTDSRSRVQSGFSAWASDFPSDAAFLRALFSCASFVPAAPQRTTNMSEFCDPAIDRQLAHAAAVQAQDPPAATAWWQKAERAILARAPIVPIVNALNVDFVSKRVGNYGFHPQWGPLLDQLWVK
jgi:YVTN family beta-propeller protein